MAVYRFNSEDAAKYGVDESIVLYNFKFWILRNIEKNNNYLIVDAYDVEGAWDGEPIGRHWTYNTVKEFTKLFPFWTEHQIRRILDSLIRQRAVYRCHPQGYNRTSWYALVDENSAYSQDYEDDCDYSKMEEGESTNGSGDNHSCSITDNKPYEKHIYDDNRAESDASVKAAAPTSACARNENMSEKLNRLISALGQGDTVELDKLRED
jgi:hypothetical protein